MMMMDMTSTSSSGEAADMTCCNCIGRMMRSGGTEDGMQSGMMMRECARNWSGHRIQTRPCLQEAKEGQREENEMTDKIRRENKRERRQQESGLNPTERKIRGKKRAVLRKRSKGKEK